MTPLCMPFIFAQISPPEASDRSHQRTSRERSAR